MTAELALLCAVAGSFGLLFGSFLNVCIYRIPRDLSVVLPRSFCPECGRSISAYDNIPLLSYLLLKGRCRACHKPIGWRYPAVELITAVLFASVAWRYGWTLAALKWATFEAFLVALFWTDLEERLLPDELTLGGSLGGLLLAIFVPVPGILSYVLPVQNGVLISLANAALAGALFAGFLWAIGALFKLVVRVIGALSKLFKLSRLRAMMRRREDLDYLGLGDVKLLLLLGIFLGLQNCLSALLIGSLAGSIISIVFLIVRRKSLFTELPYGTFLCAGAALVPLLLNT